MKQQKNILTITKHIICLVIVFLLNGNYCNAQYNLVPNPGFEQYSKCPNSFFDPQPINWYCPTNYYLGYLNICSTSPNWGIPHNGGIPNYQYAHSGNGYIGIFLFNGIGLEQRNYYQTKLKDSLKKGQCYYAEFYVAFEDNVRFGCNNVSALLTKNAVYVDTVNFPYGVLPATAQIYNYGNPVMKDTQNWVKVSSIYIAQGGEQYLTLGNFKDDAHTSLTTIVPSAYDAAGVMFDDILITPIDSMPLKADAGRDTAIHNGDSVFIGSLTNGISNITWYNSSGTIINTVAPGFWVKPSSSTFYIVEQTVCGFTSRDTVNVGVTLPLLVKSYELKVKSEKQVENIWESLNEINVSHFNIQRSTNGKDFTVVGKVKANNKSYNEYSFIDENANEGMNYYRVIAVDFDGRKQYSVIRNVELEIRNGVSIYPNPTSDVVNVVGKDIKEVKLFDMFGREIASYLAMTSNDAVVINTKNFSKGLYIVQVILTNGTIKNEKLIVE